MSAFASVYNSILRANFQHLNPLPRGGACHCDILRWRLRRGYFITPLSFHSLYYSSDVQCSTPVGGG